jgi:hypothetical protein
MQEKVHALEYQEQVILEQVKFIDVVLEEIRNRNRVLQESLGMSYAKYVGISTPYEECIHALRKVKNEFDGYLKTARSELVAKMNGRGARD